MADDLRQASCDIFIDKMVVDQANNPAQLIGSQVINALTGFFKDGEPYDHLTIKVRVGNTGPVPVAQPVCGHADTITTAGGWYCNDCGGVFPVISPFTR